MDPVNFESVLTDIDPFGYYQKVRLFCIGIPAGIICAFSLMMIFFMSYIPPHLCDIPEAGTAQFSLLPLQLQNLVERNYSKDDFMKYSRPVQTIFHQQVWSQCSMYDFQNSTAESIIDQVNANMTNLTTMSCPAGIWYGDDYGRTIIVEWDLVCEMDFVRNAIMALGSIFNLIGVLIFSYLQDKIGRKITFMLVLTWYIVFGIASALVQNALAFGILWSIRSMACYSIFQVPYILMLEIVGPDCRAFVNIYMNLMWSVGLPITVLFGYYFRDYATLIWITTIPAVPFYLLWFLLDESPRWLLLVGRDEEAIQILRKISRINGKKIDENKLVRLVSDKMKKAEYDDTASNKKLSFAVEDYGDMETQHRRNRTKNSTILSKIMSVGFVQLFARPNIALKTLITTFLWIASAVVYYGALLTVETFAFDRYLTMVLLGVIEFPAIGLGYLALDRVGRIWSMAVFTTLAGIASIVTAVIPSANFHAALFFFILSKLCIYSSFLAIYQASPEIFPTILRGTAMGFSTMVSGGIESVLPFIIYAAYELNLAGLPMLIFGSLAMVAGIFAFFLPETSYKPLPDTLEDSETQMPVSLKTFRDNVTFRTAISVYREFKGLKKVIKQKPADNILIEGNEIFDSSNVGSMAI